MCLFKRKKNSTYVALILKLDKILEGLEHAGKYYQAISHIDNLCVVLSVQYEVFHYKKDYSSASVILDRLSNIIETYEYKDFKAKFDALKSAGTTHEKLLKFYNDIVNDSQQKQQEYEKMVAEMKQMDKEERTRQNRIKTSDTIELFPIRHFQFPKSSRKEVFDILNLSETVRTTFESMWDEMEVIPVANIYCNPITEEGYGSLIQSNDINAWRNIYRIRKEFFERGFRRIDLKF